jgi:hypothetical protein
MAWKIGEPSLNDVYAENAFLEPDRAFSGAPAAA